MKNPRNFTDIAFSPAVKAMQEKLGTRARNAELARTGDRRRITPELLPLLGECRSFFLASAAKSGQPYIQHRGGPPGFLKALDAETLAFPDFKGNKQYISLGNFSENPAAMILIVDYARARRIKFWGEIEIEAENREFIESVTPAALLSRVERAFRFRVAAWDLNCPAYIPQLLPIEDVSAAIEHLEGRIRELEKELADIKS